MSKFLLILFSIGLTVACQNERDNVNKEPLLNSDTEVINKAAIRSLPIDSIIEVQVKIIKDVAPLKLYPNCGILLVDVTLNYKVIKVLKGNYIKDTILIYHVCPRMLVESKVLENNKVYTYKLKKRFAISTYEVGKIPEAVDAGDYEVVP